MKEKHFSQNWQGKTKQALVDGRPKWAHPVSLNSPALPYFPLSIFLPQPLFPPAVFPNFPHFLSPPSKHKSLLSVCPGHRLISCGL